NLSDIGFDVYAINWHSLATESNKGIFNSMFVVDALFDFIEHKIKKDVCLLTHSASGVFGWKLAEKSALVKKIIAIAPAPPGNIQDVPEYTVSDNGKTVSVFHLNAVPYTFSREKNWIADMSWIKEKAIGKNNPHFPEEFLNEYQESLVSVPSELMYERMNINGAQIKVNTVKIKEHNPKIYIFTGDQDISHSHDRDKRINDFFVKNGVDSKFFWLADYGFVGNGHMMMLQKNSQEIIDFVISRVN
ncbi:MAG: hypothetical protein AAB870_00430, partial [Patescibacteria group bacterium]